MRCGWRSVPLCRIQDRESSCLPAARPAGATDTPSPWVAASFVAPEIDRRWNRKARGSWRGMEFLGMGPKDGQFPEGAFDECSPCADTLCTHVLVKPGGVGIGLHFERLEPEGLGPLLRVAIQGATHAM